MPRARCRRRSRASTRAESAGCRPGERWPLARPLRVVRRGRTLNWYARLSASRREEIAAYLFIAPWLFGFLVFQLGAVAASFVLSFLRADFLTDWQFIGL